MLINALSDYYDILSKNGKVLPDGYSNVRIHYLISLTEDGCIDEIINCQNDEEVPAGKNKTKIKKIPKEMVMPQRTEKTEIDANIVEHRPLYLFGLNRDGDQLSPNDRTGKAQKSHKAFVKANMTFIKDLDSPVINAFRNFLLKWKPENEVENEWLLGLGKEYAKSGYAFCLSGNPDQLLHDDVNLKRKWEEEYQKRVSDNDGAYIAQCAVTGAEAPIARIHSKIKGVYGGLATGSVLIGVKHPSGWSYGNEQSYNSNISEGAMKKYTEALNYLLNSGRHKAMMDEMTIVFWAMNEKENCEDLLMKMLLGQSDKMGAEKTEDMLKSLMSDAKKGGLMRERLDSLEDIDPDVDFYMLGLKPNSSRLSVKFIFKKKYADVLWNIARFQQDLQITKELRPVYISSIKKELISPKSSNEKVNPALLASLFESVVYGKRYPAVLLETMVRRVKTDSGKEKLNAVRAGVIKACINRNYSKEELKVALDLENHGQAYLCGRLFAVLEKLQQDASGNTLNRTIKDAYFASASSKPALVFPKLIKLAQNHLNKVKYPGYYNNLIREIIGHLNGEFPETLFLTDQGKFIIGYYQQYQSFFEKTEKSEKLRETEEE